MSRIDVMLDLETWGKCPGCDIRSIGAVQFDPVAGIIAGFNGDTEFGRFYVATRNPNDRSPAFPNARKYPLHRDPETVKWWNDQSAEAQAAFADPVDLHDACKQFGTWLVSVIGGVPDVSDSPLRIWAHDPHFDVSILAAVFHAVDLPTPWHYRAPRSLRTITEAAGMTRDDFTAFNFGTAHNALDDAIAQAGIVCEAYRRLGLNKCSVALGELAAIDRDLI